MTTILGIIRDSTGEPAEGYLYIRGPRFTNGPDLITQTRVTVPVRAGIPYKVDGITELTLPPTPPDETVEVVEDFRDGRSVQRWVSIPEQPEIPYAELPELLPPVEFQTVPQWARDVLLVPGVVAGSVAAAAASASAAATSAADAETAAGEAAEARDAAAAARVAAEAAAEAAEATGVIYVPNEEVEDELDLSDYTSNVIVHATLTSDVTVTLPDSSDAPGRTYTIVATQGPGGGHALLVPDALSAYGLGAGLSATAGATDVIHILSTGAGWLLTVAAREIG